MAATLAPVSSRARRWSRGMLAGPVAFITSAAVMAGGALWVPKGAASIDNIVLPIVLFPAIWAALFFYTCLDRRLLRAWLVTLALLVVNVVMIASPFIGSAAKTTLFASDVEKVQEGLFRQPAKGAPA